MHDIDTRFPSKRVLITGAGGGLGRAMALRLDAYRPVDGRRADVNDEVNRVPRIGKRRDTGDFRRRFILLPSRCSRCPATAPSVVEMGGGDIRPRMTQRRRGLFANQLPDAVSCVGRQEQCLISTPVLFCTTGDRGRQTCGLRRRRVGTL